MAAPPATAYRVVLGVLLRSYRERLDITPKHIAETLGWYGAGKVSKVDAGTVRLTVDELDELLRLFEVGDEEAKKLREFGAEARKRTGEGRKPAWGDTYRVLAAQAAEIKAYAETVLPGLVQTESYAGALLSQSLTTPAFAVNDAASERAKMGESLTRSDGAAELWLVLSESVLHRPVGGPQVFRAQLEHLRELSALPNVTTQLLPFDKGEHHALGTPFTLLHLAVPAFTFAYLEGLTDANYLDRPQDTNIYRLAFDRLRVTALDDRATVKLLDRSIKELK